MVTLKKYEIEGKEQDEIIIKDDLLESKANNQMIKDYLVAIRNNARQWSANTKTRSEVNKTGKKPHPQKGLGRARQGSMASPQFKGGGVAFGPKPKFNMHTRINKKERRSAIRHLLIEKIKSNHALFLDSKSKIEKTKNVFAFLKKLEMQGKRVLFLGSKKDDNSNLVRCMRNIQRKDFSLLENVNGYDLALNHEIIFMDTVFEELMVILKKDNE